jgi:predicted DNA-binding transcriptional regulator YafY
MLAKRHDKNRASSIDAVVNAINDKASLSTIADLIAKCGGHCDIQFDYQKPERPPQKRLGRLVGVAGQSLRVVGHDDEQIKSFRLDRMSNVRSA